MECYEVFGIEVNSHGLLKIGQNHENASIFENLLQVGFGGFQTMAFRYAKLSSCNHHC
jgi:hypothetical protein